MNLEEISEAAMRFAWTDIEKEMLSGASLDLRLRAIHRRSISDALPFRRRRRSGPTEATDTACPWRIHGFRQLRKRRARLSGRSLTASPGACVNVGRHLAPYLTKVRTARTVSGAIYSPDMPCWKSAKLKHLFLRRRTLIPWSVTVFLCEGKNSICSRQNSSS